MGWNELQESVQLENGQNGHGDYEQQETGWQESNLQFKEKDVNDANTPHVYRNYKDRVFRLLFNNRTRLLELYNALNGSDYTNEEGCLELTVQTINVNRGHNGSLLEKSPTLYGYAYFVSLVRKNMESMELKEAVERAVDECIREDILKDFLLEQKAEVVAMSIYEYNEEYAKKANFEAGEEAGYAKGEEAGYVKGEEAGYVRGRDEGQERVNRLIRMLLEQNRINDITRAASDKAYQKKLFEELGIDVN